MALGTNPESGDKKVTRDEKQKLYTLRWYIREQWGEAHAKIDVLGLLGELLDPDSTPENRPSITLGDQHLLWCPLAETSFRAAITRGTYGDGYPKGAVIHFTAGRRNGLLSALNYQVEQGYLYFVIDKDGNIGQNFPLDSWGYHAGRSDYPGLSGKVSDDLVGIEVQCAGKLAKEGNIYRTWFQTVVPEYEVRNISTKKENQKPGYYQKFTEAQENALTTLILWLHKNNPRVFSLEFVVGHDEVSPARKNDPGGSLSMTMPKYRERLLSQAARG